MVNTRWHSMAQRRSEPRSLTNTSYIADEDSDTSSLPQEHNLKPIIHLEVV